MSIVTIPLSLAQNTNYLEEISIIHEKVYPIGLGYKNYIQNEKPDLDYYALVINTHNEVDIHFIKNHELKISESQLIHNYSLEALLNDIEQYDGFLISKLVDAQLSHVINQILSYDPEFFSKGKIIYLENTTNYMNYFKKTDQLILGDRTWKFREDEFILSKSKEN